VRVDSRYDAAFVLIRWNGRPVGSATLPVRYGALDLTALRAAIVGQAAEAIDAARVLTLLDANEPPRDDVLPSISVAVCTRDRPEDLERCLGALERTLWREEQEIVVVDSCSAGDATRLVCERHPRVRYVREARPGLDIARNRALRESRFELVAFTDDDAMPDADWLRSMQRGFRHARTLCVTGLTLPAELETDAQRWFEATNGFGRGFAPRMFDGIVHHPFDVARAGAGVNMALRRSVLDLIGPFDEALDAGTPTRSGGDHDMFTRILAGGYCIAYEPSAVCWHRHRREWHELVDTVRGYGTGVYAYLTRHLLRGELATIRISLGWLRWQVTALLRAPFGPRGRIARELGLAELRGCAEGPSAYLRSRRRAVSSGDRAT
jgi:glycosyltransferase involved in cell wall biosynthesis